MEERTKTSQSVYVPTALWAKAQSLAGNASLSLIIVELLTMWVEGKVKVVLEPKEATK